MGLVNEIGSVGEILWRFPRLAGERIVLPLDSILQLAAVDARIQDFFHLEFFMILDDNRRRWILNTVGDVVGTDGLEERHVENRMDPHRGGELETESGWPNLADDLERTETLVIKLVAGASGLDVASQEPYLLADLERRCLLDRAIVEPGLSCSGIGEVKRELLVDV